MSAALLSTQMLRRGGKQPKTYTLAELVLAGLALLSVEQSADQFQQEMALCLKPAILAMVQSTALLITEEMALVSLYPN
jgi:putative effector of murein hydrolase LrgA (UPF0299 family)